MRLIKLSVSLYFAMLVFASPVMAIDAESNGTWISVGIPKFIHIGTEGAFYLNGTNEGSCAAIKPQYFRIDMSASHWKEFYAWILTMKSLGKEINCVVDSGCGSSQVWVKYCHGPL